MHFKTLVQSLLTISASITVLSCASPSKDSRTPASDKPSEVHCTMAAQTLINDWFKGQMVVGCEAKKVTYKEPYMIEDHACSVAGTGMNTTLSVRMKFDPITRECLAISNR
ncbi:MAG: hypothetical protein ACK5P7_12030 [Bdellovibrio sp.]